MFKKCLKNVTIQCSEKRPKQLNWFVKLQTRGILSQQFRKTGLLVGHGKSQTSLYFQRLVGGKKADFVWSLADIFSTNFTEK